MASETVNQALAGDESLDLHDSYRVAHECGFNRDLILRTDSAQKIASRLRGISGITAVLMTDGCDVELGSFIRGALVEAVDALTLDCITDLDDINSRQKEQQVAA